MMEKHVPRSLKRLHRRYPASRMAKDGIAIELARVNGHRRLVVVVTGGIFPQGLEVESELQPAQWHGRWDIPEHDRDKKTNEGERVGVCLLSARNAAWIRSQWPELGPCTNPGIPISIGLGDRLGKASAGHLKALEGMSVFPVLAQQSMRELKLTGRTYEEVLDAATWAVFETGWRDGYGADGDHLKTGEEIAYALGCGFTMITLDCSDHIDKALASLSDGEIRDRYMKLGEGERLELESLYMDGHDGTMKELGILMGRTGFERRVLTYRGAIAHAVDIYRTQIRTAGRAVDYEISIDETATVTSPADHAFVALELLRNEVRFISLAPRFCGEFQKGIDYRGDIDRFLVEFKEHARIARKLGYRLSIHSGSDKFLVFPIIGEEAPEGFHLKTAGTNWLEALRVLAVHEPDLFRMVLGAALASLEEARRFYHISGNEAKIPPVESLSDLQLPGLLDRDDARQILHITYGHVLKTVLAGGGTLGDRIHEVLDELEDEYADGLRRHLERHLEALGLCE
jgi:hypothetical protein